MAVPSCGYIVDTLLNPALLGQYWRPHAWIGRCSVRSNKVERESVITDGHGDLVTGSVVHIGAAQKCEIEAAVLVCLSGRGVRRRPLVVLQCARNLIGAVIRRHEML